MNDVLLYLLITCNYLKEYEKVFYYYHECSVYRLKVNVLTIKRLSSSTFSLFSLQYFHFFVTYNGSRMQLFFAKFGLNRDISGI